MDRSDIHFPPKHEPLREDVHALGALMGEILREQGGQQLFELVELDRVAAIRGRAGSHEARAELAACVRERSPALARDVVRAFSTWFQSVNLAERVHRIRRRREYLLKESQRPQPGGVEDAIAALNACPERLYNRYDEGGFLIWFVRGQKVFLDSRQDPFPSDLVRAHIRADETGDYEDLFDRFSIRCAFVPAASPMAQRLTANGWQHRYEGLGFVVLARDGSAANQSSQPPPSMQRPSAH